MQVAQKVVFAGADVLQFRAKLLPDEKISKAAKQIKEIAQEHKVTFLLNDLVDLAKTLDVDGVHLGQSDLSITETRKILGEEKIIGRSTHSVEQAVEAEKEGADYIAVGPAFATPLKPQAKSLGLEIIKEIRNRVKIPFVAVGGINLNNLDQVLATGAECVAVCRGIIATEDIPATTKEFRQRLYN